MSKKLMRSAASSAVLVFCASTAAAQTAEEPYELETITVIAQKRAEDVTRVPLAITAVSGETLERRRVDELQQLRTIDPSLSFRQSTGPQASGFIIRGVGTSSFSSGIEQSVSTVLDGVVLTPMTMRQLMSHSAGFDFGMGYNLAELTATDLAGMVEKLSALPLAFQPGSDWRYGPSVDVQAYIVEKLSGMSLDQFLRTHIFEPLTMSDTGFYVPVTSAHRVVGVNTYDGAGKITPAPARRDPTVKPTFLSGSGGLFSTAIDYWRFAQMVANEGVLDDVRIIEAASARLLRQDMLPSNVKVDVYGPAQEGVGFGLNFAVLVDPLAAGSPMGKGSHWWGGGYGTWFWIDPENEIVFIVLIQNLRGTIPHAGTPPLRDLTPRLVYSALRPRRG